MHAGCTVRHVVLDSDAVLSRGSFGISSASTTTMAHDLLAATIPALPSVDLRAHAADLFNIDAALTEEERAVRDTIRAFVDEKILPIIGGCYVEGRFPTELIPELAELGVLGASLPEEYGCAGLSSVAYGLIMQEIGRASCRERV